MNLCMVELAGMVCTCVFNVYALFLFLPHFCDSQGGLTWLWLDAPYVIAARKLFTWAVEENNKGNPFPVSDALSV